MTPSEIAREIALWLYGPDEGISEGLVRTLIDKIEQAISEAVLAERERCSEIAECRIYKTSDPNEVCRMIAKAIRESEKP